MRAARALTNASVSASRAMWRGTLHGMDVEPVDDHGASWRTATPLQRRIVSGMFGRHLQSFRSGRRLQSEGERASALSHVCKGPLVHYAGSILPEPAADNTLPKGALCPLVVGELSIPPVGVSIIDPRDCSPTLARYYEDALEKMVLDRSSVDWENYNKITPYTDPALNDPAVMGTLLIHLCDANMLANSDEAEEFVDLFAVVKSDVATTSGDVARKSRMVWDERRANLRFTTPPKMPMGSAASLSFLNLSEQWLGEGFEPLAFTGDLPDWFCRIALPTRLRPFFVFRGWSWDRLNDLLISQGRRPRGLQGHVTLGVLPMGWSWAPFLAHTLTLAIVETALEGSGSQRLVDGQPTPQLTQNRPVHWAYLDDFGVMTTERTATIENSDAATLQEKVRKEFLKLGVKTHKETLQEGLAPNLGVSVSADRTLSILEDKWWQLEAATEQLCRVRRASPRQLSSVIGGWVWTFTVCRELLSVLSSVYAFIGLPDPDATRGLWSTVLCELRTLLALAPFGTCPLALPWSPTVLMVDASNTGYGGVARTADCGDVQEEARWAEKKGWTVEVDRIYSETEYLEHLGEDSPEMRGMTDYSLDDVSRFARPVRIFLHIFSGRRRAEDLQHYVEQLAFEQNLVVKAVSLDTQVDAEKGDLSSETVVLFWENQIYNGRVIGAHSGDPCGTWSRIRFLANGGPRPVRSEEEPWGLADLTYHEQRAVTLSNALLTGAVRILSSLATMGRQGSREHPADPGPGYPSSWRLPQWMRFLDEGLHDRTTFHQCRVGARTMKPTTLQGSIDLHLAKSFGGLFCNHPRGTHDQLGGKGPDGRFLTSIAMEYPPELCRKLAQCFVNAWIQANENNEAQEQETYTRVRGRRRPVPLLHERWRNPRDWHEIFRGRWQMLEHNNLLEGRAALAALRHLARSSKNWSKRHLLFTDSLVVLGAFGKGRSSSPALLRLCRRWAMFRILLQMRTYLRYVPTDLNHSDGPSRQQAIGWHAAQPQTKEKKTYLGLG